jgi:hypothetical protein
MDCTGISQGLSRGLISWQGNRHSHKQQPDLSLLVLDFPDDRQQAHGTNKSMLATKAGMQKGICMQRLA